MQLDTDSLRYRSITLAALCWHAVPNKETGVAVSVSGKLFQEFVINRLFFFFFASGDVLISDDCVSHSSRECGSHSLLQYMHMLMQACIWDVSVRMGLVRTRGFSHLDRCPIFVAMHCSSFAPSPPDCGLIQGKYLPIHWTAVIRQI